MSDDPIICYVESNGVARLILDRPEKRNAFNAEVIQGISANLHTLSKLDEVRLLVLEANGKHFSAGGDLHWMQSMRYASEADNSKDAEQLADMLDHLNHFPHPTIANVQGAVYGGAVGLVSCCDMAVADTSATFCFSEVKLGLSPATISPYVIAAIGAQQARRYLLTAEAFSAEKAQVLGLIHEVTASAEERQQQVNNWINALLSNGPQAVKATKQLIRDVNHRPIDDALKQETSALIARLRVSEEGQEGLSAFFEKRPASYACSKDEPTS